MKKLFLFLLILPLAFYACGDDDETEKDPADMTIEEYMSEDRPFVWNGDWNDPDDPNYKKNGYNPIVGYWLYEKGGTVVLRYTEDLQEVIYDLDVATKTLVYRENSAAPYVINDRAFWRNKDNSGTCYFYGFGSDGTLYINDMGQGVGESSIVRKKNWVIQEKFDETKVTVIGGPK